MSRSNDPPMSMSDLLLALSGEASHAPPGRTTATTTTTKAQKRRHGAGYDIPLRKDDAVKVGEGDEGAKESGEGQPLGGARGERAGQGLHEEEEEEEEELKEREEPKNPMDGAFKALASETAAAATDPGSLAALLHAATRAMAESRTAQTRAMSDEGRTVLGTVNKLCFAADTQPALRIACCEYMTHLCAFASIAGNNRLLSALAGIEDTVLAFVGAQPYDANVFVAISNLVTILASTDQKVAAKIARGAEDILNSSKAATPEVCALLLDFVLLKRHTTQATVRTTLELILKQRGRFPASPLIYQRILRLLAKAGPQLASTLVRTHHLMRMGLAGRAAELLRMPDTPGAADIFKDVSQGLFELVRSENCAVIGAIAYAGIPPLLLAKMAEYPHSPECIDALYTVFQIMTCQDLSVRKRTAQDIVREGGIHSLSIYIDANLGEGPERLKCITNILVEVAIRHKVEEKAAGAIPMTADEIRSIVACLKVALRPSEAMAAELFVRIFVMLPSDDEQQRAAVRAAPELGEALLHYLPFLKVGAEPRQLGLTIIEALLDDMFPKPLAPMRGRVIMDDIPEKLAADAVECDSKHELRERMLRVLTHWVPRLRTSAIERVLRIYLGAVSTDNVRLAHNLLQYVDMAVGVHPYDAVALLLETDLPKWLARALQNPEQALWEHAFKTSLAFLLSSPGSELAMWDNGLVLPLATFLTKKPELREQREAFLSHLTPDNAEESPEQRAKLALVLKDMKSSLPESLVKQLVVVVGHEF